MGYRFVFNLAGLKEAGSWTLTRFELEWFMAPENFIWRKYVDFCDDEETLSRSQARAMIREIRGQQ